MNTIKVLICDDHTLVREGLRLLLGAAEDIELVGEAEHGRQAVQETKRLFPDVVLLDLSMPQLNGVEATRQIAREVPSAKVLILSAYSDEQHMQAAIEAGAAGYLMKGTSADDLLPAVRAIAKGNTFFRPSVPRRLLKQWQEKSPNDCRVRTNATMLTSRETEVLQLIAEGYANKQIAGFLSISQKTVEKHRQTLMHKLHLHNVAMLTRYAVSTGIVESNCAPQLAGENTAARPRLARGNANFALTG